MGSHTRRAIQSLMAEKDKTEKVEELAGWRAARTRRPWEGTLPVGHGGRREAGVTASLVTASQAGLELPSRLRLSKKVLMERERRRGLAALFDSLEAATWPALAEEQRGRSSYGKRVRAARACIRELEGAVGRREEEWGREVARRTILTHRLHTLTEGEGAAVPSRAASRQFGLVPRMKASLKAPKLYICPVGCGASQASHRDAFLHQVSPGHIQHSQPEPSGEPLQRQLEPAPPRLPAHEGQATAGGAGVQVSHLTGLCKR